MLQTEIITLNGKEVTVTEASLRMDMARTRWLETFWKPETDPEIKSYKFGYCYLAAVTLPLPTFDDYLDLSIADAEKWIETVSRLNPTFFPGTNPTMAVEAAPPKAP